MWLFPTPFNWSFDIMYAHQLWHIMTFLIIVPYKYCYLLTYLLTYNWMNWCCRGCELDDHHNHMSPSVKIDGLVR